jgi:hypothetical protein
MKKKLCLIFLIFITSCGSETVEELTEYDKCLQSYKAIQEANLALNELMTVYQDSYGNDYVLIQYNGIKGRMDFIWFTYYEWVVNREEEWYIEAAKENGFFDYLTYIDNNIKTEEEFKNFIGLPIAEIKKINENLDLIEPNVNNLTNYSGYKNLLNNTVEIFELYIASLPEVSVVLDEDGRLADEYIDKLLSVENYVYDIFNPELSANIYASNIIVELYDKCVDN